MSFKKERKPKSDRVSLPSTKVGQRCPFHSSGFRWLLVPWHSGLNLQTRMDCARGRICARAACAHSMDVCGRISALLSSHARKRNKHAIAHFHFKHMATIGGSMKARCNDPASFTSPKHTSVLGSKPSPLLTPRSDFLPAGRCSLSTVGGGGEHSLFFTCLLLNVMVV